MRRVSILELREAYAVGAAALTAEVDGPRETAPTEYEDALIVSEMLLLHGGDLVQAARRAVHEGISTYDHLKDKDDAPFYLRMNAERLKPLMLALASVLEKMDRATIKRDERLFYDDDDLASMLMGAAASEPQHEAEMA